MFKWEILGLKEQIGNVLKLARLRRMISQTDLGNEVDLSKNQISRIELGVANTTLSNLLNLCNFLEVNISSIFIKMHKSAAEEMQAEIERLEHEFKKRTRKQFKN